MRPQHIYFLPGIGADERLFSGLQLNGFRITCLRWLPAQKNESIESYAEKLCRQINTNEAFAIVGVSLGGIVAVEMAKIINPQKLVLISSIKTKDELPPYFRFFRFLPIYKLLKKWLLQRCVFVIRPFFGKMQNAEYKVFKDMLLSSDLEFIKWASHNIVNWKNTRLPQNCLHLHGTADKILPVKYIRNFEPVIGGTHYMVVRKAKLLSERINTFLGA